MLTIYLLSSSPTVEDTVQARQERRGQSELAPTLDVNETRTSTANEEQSRSSLSGVGLPVVDRRRVVDSLYWFHIHKCGTSAVALWRTALTACRVHGYSCGTNRGGGPSPSSVLTVREVNGLDCAEQTCQGTLKACKNCGDGFRSEQSWGDYLTGHNVVTMIREPTERAVSHLYYEYVVNQRFHALSADDKVAEVKKRFRTHGYRRNDNYQTFRLAGIPTKATLSNLTSERATEILEAAWTNLVNGTVYFGITDDWSRSVCVFWRTFVSVQTEGVDFNSRVGLGQEDDDGARSYVEKFDIPFLLEIQETNRLDMILYARAIAHFRRRVKRLGCDDAKDMLSRQRDPSHLDVPSAATSDGVTVEG